MPEKSLGRTFVPRHLITASRVSPALLRLDTLLEIETFFQEAARHCATMKMAAAACWFLMMLSGPFVTLWKK
jgi:hypothetical protein